MIKLLHNFVLEESNIIGLFLYIFFCYIINFAPIRFYIHDNTTTYFILQQFLISLISLLMKLSNFI